MLPSSANPFPRSSTAIQRASRISSALSDSFILAPCFKFQVSSFKFRVLTQNSKLITQNCLISFYHFFQLFKYLQFRRVLIKTAGAAHHLAAARLAALAAPFDPFLFRELVAAISALHIKPN